MATAAEGALRHGANVLRALARNLEAVTDPDALGAPLDHASARDAVTLLGWRGECTSETLQEALDLSQPACVRVVDRLAAAGLVTRRRTPGDRRLHVPRPDAGERPGSRLVRGSRAGVERALSAALPARELDGF